MGNPTVTPIVEKRHAGGFIVAEDQGRYDRDAITVAQGFVLDAGTVMGAETVGTTAAAVALGTNTGNGTFGAIGVAAPAVSGAYVVNFEDATHFTVEGPDGAEIGHGTAGQAFAAGGLTFVITAGGTAFVAGDSFTVTVAPGLGNWAPYNPTASDGTEVARGILYHHVDTTVAARKATAVTGGPVKVNTSELVWGPGVTTQPQQAAGVTQLQALGIKCMGAQPDIWS